MNSTADRIIYVSLAVLAMFGVMSFFKLPLYEKGAWEVIAVAATALSGALGFKFGVSSPKDTGEPK